MVCLVINGERIFSNEPQCHSRRLNTGCTRCTRCCTRLAFHHRCWQCIRSAFALRANLPHSHSYLVQTFTTSSSITTRCISTPTCLRLMMKLRSIEETTPGMPTSLYRSAEAWISWALARCEGGTPPCRSRSQASNSKSWVSILHELSRRSQ